MIMVFTKEITEVKHLINRIHFEPDTLGEKDKQGGFLLSREPMFEEKVGKDMFRYINPQTLETWAEYENRPLMANEVEQELQEQGEEIAQLWYQIMMMG